ncbi:hypothetical protein V8B55DRAFT_1341366 [Mucor lusitanicus]|uniref:Uncharacterized protein n=1 Tax=Mucor circinelloides f. lusitanicus TaxID=29924 RepID=A0A8H4BC98_MUCCL|nr:hypothetical protein FB192DRAFT_1386603 [Mucor lusitanicus]
MKLFMFIFVCATLPLMYAAPTAINKSTEVMKREDSADRQQEAALGGAARGLVIPNIFGIVPQNPLGGQAPDED